MPSLGRFLPWMLGHAAALRHRQRWTGRNPCAMLARMAEPRLSMAARAFRGLHGLIAVVFLLAIVYVWWCALTGRRDRWLRAAVAALVTEGCIRDRQPRG